MDQASFKEQLHKLRTLRQEIKAAESQVKEISQSLASQWPEGFKTVVVDGLKYGMETRYKYLYSDETENLCLHLKRVRASERENKIAKTLDSTYIIYCR